MQAASTVENIISFRYLSTGWEREKEGWKVWISQYSMSQSEKLSSITKIPGELLGSTNFISDVGFRFWLKGSGLINIKIFA